MILNGSGKEPIGFQTLAPRGGYTTKSYPFEGVLASMARRYHESDSTAVREELAKYQNNKPCPACNGTRLREEARHVMVGSVPIYVVSAMPLKQVLVFFETLKLDGHRAQHSHPGGDLSSALSLCFDHRCPQGANHADHHHHRSRPAKYLHRHLRLGSTGATSTLQCRHSHRID